MFIDKDQLLKTLNKLYQEHSSCCISLYSYPGQGKSRLLAEFMKEKTCLYFKASCVPWQENFSMLKEQCSRSLGKSFSSCQKASQLLKALKKDSTIFLFQEKGLPVFAVRIRRQHPAIPQ